MRGRLALAGLGAAALAGVVYVYASPTVSEAGRLAAAVPRQALPPARKAVGPIVVPVAGVGRGQLTDTWGQSRENGARVHEAIDIPAPGGTPVLAALPGRVEKLFQSARGGTTLYVRSADGLWSAYYAHLQRYANGLGEGQAVRQGQLLGYVGDTGDAGPGNTHLHFALARMGPGDRWWQGEPVNPYPILVGRAPLR